METMTQTQARQVIAALLPDEVNKKRLLEMGYCYREFRGTTFSGEVTVSISERLVNSLANVPTYTYKVTLNWSGTERSLAQATDAVNRYQEALVFAATVAATVEEFGKVLEDED